MCPPGFLHNLATAAWQRSSNASRHRQGEARPEGHSATVQTKQRKSGTIFQNYNACVQNKVGTTNCISTSSENQFAIRNLHSKHNALPQELHIHTHTQQNKHGKTNTTCKQHARSKQLSKHTQLYIYIKQTPSDTEMHVKSRCMKHRICKAHELRQMAALAFEYLPAEHAVHSVASRPENVSGSHLRQAVLATVSA